MYDSTLFVGRGSSDSLPEEQVATLLRKDSPTVRLETDLHLVFSDLYEGNFMFTATGDTYLIDFEQTNFLPLSFMTYALIQDSAVCRALGKKFQVDLPQENIMAMQRICRFFIMSTRTLGKNLSPLHYSLLFPIDRHYQACPRPRAEIVIMGKPRGSFERPLANRTEGLIVTVGVDTCRPQLPT